MYLQRERILVVHMTMLIWYVFPPSNNLHTIVASDKDYDDDVNDDDLLRYCIMYSIRCLLAHIQQYQLTFSLALLFLKISIYIINLALWHGAHAPMSTVLVAAAATCRHSQTHNRSLTTRKVGNHSRVD